MTVEQIQAIAAMSLTAEDMAALMPGGLSGDMGDVTSSQSDSSSVMAAPAGGDFAGGAPGEMPDDMDGMAGTSVSSGKASDPSQTGGGSENMQETMLTHAVISLLTETVTVMEN